MTDELRVYEIEIEVIIEKIGRVRRPWRWLYQFQVWRLQRMLRDYRDHQIDRFMKEHT